MEMVTVEFDAPRTIRQINRSYFLAADGQDEVQLPCSKTTLITEDTPGGTVAIGAKIPRFIAEDRGLIDAPKEETTTVDAMTRYDWFLLGSTVALLAGDCESPGRVMYEAKKLARRLMAASEANR